MNVLLVEPVAKATYPSMGLMKLSSMYKSRGDTVSFTRGLSYFLPREADVICITSLFTWGYQEVIDSINFYKARYPGAEIRVGGVATSLLADKIAQETGVTPHKGLLQEAEAYPLDYTVYPRIGHSIAKTSIGCIRKCGWCAIRILEPEYHEIPDWDKYYVNPRHSKRILFHDNNFLASTEEHFTETIAKIRRLGASVDFNQGLDCRLYDDFHAKKLRMIRVSPLRFSWDSRLVDDSIVDAITRSKKMRAGETSVYMLFNFNERPEEIWNRMDVLNSLRVTVFPMCYQPLDQLYKSGIDEEGGWTGHRSRHWSVEALTGFRRLVSWETIDGSIGSGMTRERFHSLFGEHQEDFEGKLCEWKREANARQQALISSNRKLTDYVEVKL